VSQKLVLIVINAIGIVNRLWYMLTTCYCLLDSTATTRDRAIGEHQGLRRVGVEATLPASAPPKHCLWIIAPLHLSYSFLANGLLTQLYIDLILRRDVGVQSAVCECVLQVPYASSFAARNCSSATQSVSVADQAGPVSCSRVRTRSLISAPSKTRLPGLLPGLYCCGPLRADPWPAAVAFLKSPLSCGRSPPISAMSQRVLAVLSSRAATHSSFAVPPRGNSQSTVAGLGFSCPSIHLRESAYDR
jgi:hypothetical protein